MKIMMITTPIRPTPTNFPPIGSLSIISYLRRNGVEGVEFYNIDANRPSFDEALSHIVAARPDVLGISSVVSTAYEYTKKISMAVKAALPKTLIVLGGNLAASAEVILRRTGVDICVLGEGEKVFLDVVRRAETSRNRVDFVDIAGLALIDRDGRLINTGYTDALDKSEIYDIDWTILEQSSNLDTFFIEFAPGTIAYDKFSREPRSHEPHRRGKRYVMIPGAKGCVAKCTFCHRWEKGIRYIPPSLFVERLEHMIERYNVGFIAVADENFGTDRKWLQEFCELMKKTDVLWIVSGMRVNCITPEQIAMMRDAGCVMVLYGMETGSPRMLEVMEKKTKQVDNENAMRWTIEGGLHTIVQLVLGMPGENPETVRETIEFSKMANTLSAAQSPNDLSVNYAQALPGTPLYEFARHRGKIGSGLDGEEEYLLRISDRDAHDEVTTINFTDYPSLICETWRPLIAVEVNYAFVKKFGIDTYLERTLADKEFFAQPNEDTGYFANPKRIVDAGRATNTIRDVTQAIQLTRRNVTPSIWQLYKARKFGLALICYPRLAYYLRHVMLLLVIYKNLQRNGRPYTMKLVREYLAYRVKWLFGRRTADHTFKSLRRTVRDDLGEIPTDDKAMAPLRAGR